MVHVIVVGILTVFIVALFTRQIVDQLGSGKMRFRGSVTYKTRKGNPVSYWFGIGLEIAVILMAVYLFSQAVLKASK